MHRRHFISQFGLFANLLSGPIAVDAKRWDDDLIQTGEEERPNQATFQDGDLVWPKLRTSMVPFNSRPGEGRAGDRLQWETERAEYVRVSPDRATDDPLVAQRFRALSILSYEQFVSRYLDDVDPVGQAPLSATPFFYVGHVGIIHFIRDVPHVVEAVPEKGVRAQAYAEWLRARPGELVWHGRLAGAGIKLRTSMALTAFRYLDRPYHFWNLDLSDDSSFYCSKLVWLAITKSAGIPPDDDKEARRRFWYSPKRLMRSPHLQMLFNPRRYSF